ncbi:IgGFc-binding protein [Nannocystaceae bacterium ST9]
MTRLTRLARPTSFACLFVSTLACGGGGDGEDRNGDDVALEDSTSAPTSESGSSTTDADDSSSTAADSSTGEGDGDGDSGIKFDVGVLPDDGGLDTGDEGPVIPETCEQASTAETTVGCLFYAVDLDQNGPLESDQYAIAVSNVQLEMPASVTVERKVGGVWQVVAGPQMIPPLDLHVFPLPNNNQQSSGIKADGSWRVSSDVPIIAYQFNPLIQGAASSDASMLYPVTSWDYINQVIHWGVGYGRGYITIVAAEDGTMVEVTPAVTTMAGPGVPGGVAGVPFMISLQEGEIAEVMVVDEHAQLTGTKVVSDENHPVAVFSGHECAWIPVNVVACDHIEEQLSGVRLWGTEFAGGRMPVRYAPAPETSLWQILASEDGTTVTIEAHAEVTGLPASPAMLDQGEKLEFFAGGSIAHPGDLRISASKPIAVTNYMTGFGNLPATNDGDPAMVQLSAIEQFLPRYVVLVPDQWTIDILVITKPVGSEVSVDGVAVPDDQFLDFGDGEWEAARYMAADGVHLLEGTEPFSVVVVGYDGADSYAYLGGSSTGKINPSPQG